MVKQVFRNSIERMIKSNFKLKAEFNVAEVPSILEEQKERIKEKHCK